jgi:C_GCAxxG_C_C family probable redox protein
MENKNLDLSHLEGEPNEEIFRSLDYTLQPAVELSLKYFKNGLFCSEAILRAFNEVYELGLPINLYKISTGFGVGFGGAKSSCGAFTGAVIVLNLISGRNNNYDSADESFASVNQLYTKFTEKFKTLSCKALTHSVEWGSQEHSLLCEDYVGSAAIIIDELIKNELKSFVDNGDKLFIEKYNLNKK